MNPGIVEQVQEAIAPIAEKLEHGAEFLYETFYRQVVIEGIITVTIPIVLCVVSLFLTTFWYKFANKKAASSRDNDNDWKVAAWLRWTGSGDVGNG